MFKHIGKIYRCRLQQVINPADPACYEPPSPTKKLIPDQLPIVIDRYQHVRLQRSCACVHAHVSHVGGEITLDSVKKSHSVTYADSFGDSNILLLVSTEALLMF